MTLRLYTHPDCLAHDPGSGHPECPQRLQGILNALHNHPGMDGIEFRDAPLGRDEDILLVHTQNHLDYIRQSLPAEGETSLDADTHMSPGSLNAALRAVGGACQGVDDLMTGAAESVFCATRPPGHHATPTHAMGFCLFNQVAIATLYAKQHYQLPRVAIVDFDVHHGNGTQDAMRDRDGVFYISTHQSPLYPGSGLESENIDNRLFNIPLHGGTGHDTYIRIFEERVIPAVAAYEPQLLLVSAGFDAHKLDPLAGMALTDDTYYWLGSTLKGLARLTCGGKLLSVLEGGYHLETLPGSVIAYLEGMQDPAGFP